MKTMCPPSYRQNDFVATHALGHMMYSYTLLIPMNQRVLNKLIKGDQQYRGLKCHRSKINVICFHDCIYIMLVLLL